LASVEVEVKGVERLAKIFQEYADSLQAELDSVMDQAAQYVHDTAITLVPVRTGRLKSTIHIEKGDEPLTRIVKAGGSEAPYAPFVEYGTRKMAAQPFMRPAAEARRNEIVKLITDFLKRFFKQD
jgi:HK97 gp10 family phage protein